MGTYVGDDLERIWNGAVLACFKVLSSFSGETEEEHENLSCGSPQLRFKLGTS